MSGTRRLEISDQHLSATTADLVGKRMDLRNGASFFREGERMAPMFGDMSFQIGKFSDLYDRDPERLEAALPHDLLFLHLFARANGYEEMVISQRADTDPRLPVYVGNAIADIGDTLRGQEVRLSGRKPRQMPEAARVPAVSPRQIRLGQVAIAAPPDDSPCPA